VLFQLHHQADSSLKRSHQVLFQLHHPATSNSIIHQPAQENLNAAFKCYSSSIIKRIRHSNAAIKCYSNSIIQQLPTPSSINLPIKTYSQPSSAIPTPSSSGFVTQMQPSSAIPTPSSSNLPLRSN
jgi:hypothetical protein